jgi:hypothetical protein
MAAKYDRTITFPETLDTKCVQVLMKELARG